MYYLVKSGKTMGWLYPSAHCFIPNEKNQIFLTFDDGPVLGVTDKVLEILQLYQAKASFFCVGENIVKNPSLFQDIIDAGHTVGNHSYNHINGWKNSLDDYIINIQKCGELFDFKWFRPPYGKMKKKSIPLITEKYKIAFWDVLAGDFDSKNSVTQIVDNVCKNTESGSIIVLHDNEKSAEKMLLALPIILKTLTDKGYIFAALEAV